MTEAAISCREESPTPLSNSISSGVKQEVELGEDIRQPVGWLGWCERLRTLMESIKGAGA
jgi:hypothetical protein